MYKKSSTMYRCFESHHRQKHDRRGKDGHSVNEDSTRPRWVAVVFLSWVFSMIDPAYANGADLTVFQLKPVKEIVLLAGGFSVKRGGRSLVSRANGPDLNTLDKHFVPAIDGFARRYYSERVSRWSDYTRDATSGLMLLTALTLLEKRRKENFRAFLTDILMFIEAKRVVIGLTNMSKGLVRRPRPYAHNTHLSEEKRKERDASMSFWSGHSSLAFTTAVFTGYVFQNRHPASRFITPVWVFGISCASATAIFRVRSGNHFPTDVVAGAAAGSLVGWVVPRIHRREAQSFSVHTAVNGANGLGVKYSF